MKWKEAVRKVESGEMCVCQFPSCMEDGRPCIYFDHFKASLGAFLRRMHFDVPDMKVCPYCGKNPKENP
jgi:hypothetical protein